MKYKDKKPVVGHEMFNKYIRFCNEQSFSSIQTTLNRQADTDKIKTGLKENNLAVLKLM